MIQINYRVRFINANGGIVDGGTAAFTEGTTLKQATIAVAQENNRHPDNVRLTELHREVL